jgi:acylphosphatase
VALPSGRVTGHPSEPVKDDRKRITVLYSGNVQGVGFRFTTRDVAAGFDVCGTVRNLADGRVELVAEGTTAELEAFRQAIRDSGLGPLIRGEQLQWATPRGDLRGFQILR